MAKEQFTKYTCDICKKERLTEMGIPYGWARAEFKLYNVSVSSWSEEAYLCGECSPVDSKGRSIFEKRSSCLSYFISLFKKTQSRINE